MIILKYLLQVLILPHKHSRASYYRNQVNKFRAEISRDILPDMLLKLAFLIFFVFFPCLFHEFLFFVALAKCKDLTDRRTECAGFIFVLMTFAQVKLSVQLNFFTRLQSKPRPTVL